MSGDFGDSIGNFNEILDETIEILKDISGIKEYQKPELQADMKKHELFDFIDDVASSCKLSKAETHLLRRIQLKDF